MSDSARFRPRRVTLRDVADVANVDTSVVSRVVNGDPGLSISSATRERVENALRSLNYRPNFSARSLRMERTMTLGYLLPSFPNPVGEQLIQGAQATALDHGYTVLLGLTAGEDGIAGAFEHLLGEGRVDGLLVNTGAMTDDDVRRVAHGSAPVVVVNRSVAGARCSVILDDQAYGRLAAKHLVDLGHRRLGHVGGPEVTDTAVRRRNGFLSAAVEASIEAVVDHASDWDYVAGAESAERLLKSAPGLSGIVAANVSLAVGALSALHKNRLAVPEQVSVIALHDASLAWVSSPPLTTIATPLFELGAEGVIQLIRTLHGEEVPELVIVGNPEARIVQRASTAPANSV